MNFAPTRGKVLNTLGIMMVLWLIGTLLLVVLPLRNCALFGGKNTCSNLLGDSLTWSTGLMDPVLLIGVLLYTCWSLFQHKDGDIRLGYSRRYLIGSTIAFVVMFLIVILWSAPWTCGFLEGKNTCSPVMMMFEWVQKLLFSLPLIAFIHASIYSFGTLWEPSEDEVAIDYSPTVLKVMVSVLILVGVLFYPYVVKEGGDYLSCHYSQGCDPGFSPPTNILTQLLYLPLALGTSAWVYSLLSILQKRAKEDVVY